MFYCRKCKKEFKATNSKQVRAQKCFNCIAKNKKSGKKGKRRIKVEEPTEILFEDEEEREETAQPPLINRLCSCEHCSCCPKNHNRKREERLCYCPHPNCNYLYNYYQILFDLLDDCEILANANNKFS